MYCNMQLNIALARDMLWILIMLKWTTILCNAHFMAAFIHRVDIYIQLYVQSLIHYKCILICYLKWHEGQNHSLIYSWHVCRIFESMSLSLINKNIKRNINSKLLAICATHNCLVIQVYYCLKRCLMPLKTIKLDLHVYMCSVNLMNGITSLLYIISFTDHDFAVE